MRNTATTKTTEKVRFADADEIHYVVKYSFADLRGNIRDCENPECQDPDWSTLGRRREEKRTACTRSLAMHYCPLSPMKRFLVWVNYVAQQKQMKQLEMFNPVGRRALFVQWRHFAARRKEDTDDEDDDDDDEDGIFSAANTIPIHDSDDESWGSNADDDVAQLSDVE